MYAYVNSGRLLVSLVIAAFSLVLSSILSLISLNHFTGMATAGVIELIANHTVVRVIEHSEGEFAAAAND